MVGSVNKVILIGNLGRDPEVRFNPEGGKIVTLSIATSETWKDKASGEKRDRTEWHRVVVFNDKLAEVAEKFLKKGSKVYLEGQLQTRKWTDQQGQERYTTEIVLGRYRGELTMLDARGSGMGDESGLSEDPQAYMSAAGSSSMAGNSGGFGSGFSTAPLGSDTLNDDVPF